MIGSLADFGYATKTYPEGALSVLEGILNVNSKATIIDTRRNPRCYWSEHWRRPWLEAHFKHRYRSKGHWLGNVNYDDPDKGIELADPDHGIPWIIHQLEHGQTLILLCACVDYQRCHRKVIYDLVKAAMGNALPEYWPGQRVLTPDGPGTIYDLQPVEVQRARNRYGVVLDQTKQVRYTCPYDLQLYADEPLVQQSLIA